jgi:hypothetical protein
MRVIDAAFGLTRPKSYLPIFKLDVDISCDVCMRTFLLFLPFLLLRKELFLGVCCKRESEDVEDESEDCFFL